MPFFKCFTVKQGNLIQLEWSQFVTHLGANIAIGGKHIQQGQQSKKCSIAFVLNCGWRLDKSSEREKKKNEFGEW